jgi:hypothetical protein
MATFRQLRTRLPANAGAVPTPKGATDEIRQFTLSEIDSRLKTLIAFGADIFILGDHESDTPGTQSGDC